MYLPPTYRVGTRRYPVVYLLHGFTDDDDNWFGRVKHFVDVPAIVDATVPAAGGHELIVVMPNARNRFFGSMYSNSITTGDWETFVAKELVAAIDTRYRTLSAPDSRGLAGHSMGGYGTLKLAMKYPGIFGAIYALSPCCMLPVETVRRRTSKAEAVTGFDELTSADFWTKVAVAGAAAWSPNPNAPPFFADLLTRDGVVQAIVAARWTANSPLAMLDQYLSNLRNLRAIGLDAGDKDIAGLSEDARTFSERLTANGIRHSFEIYPGTHVSGVAERIKATVLPFFWKNLTF